MALRLMRQLNVIKLKLVGEGVRCCRGVFWERTHYIACVLRDRRRKGRENREGIGDRKKGTNNNNG